MVEFLPSKQDVAGSNPVSRSTPYPDPWSKPYQRLAAASISPARSTGLTASISSAML